jgi:ferric-dicitrate binding protein FerR (iron transport regulator)
MTDRAGDIAMLIKKHITNGLTEIEKDQLAVWIKESEENQKVFDELTNEDSLQNALKDLFEFKQAHENKQDSPVVDLYSTTRGSSWIRIAAAAVIVLVLGISYYVYTIKRTDQTAVVTNAGIKKTPQDIAPGGNKAVLTLADGSTIILDSAQNGLIAEQDKIAIKKSEDGKLVYDSKDAVTEVYYNTISTPKGGQYQLTLSDGSKIWMNAASALRFPTAFTGSERMVELDGEAYFEVVKNVLKPFIVKSKNGITIQVLGTHFNMMAYNEEKETKATLIEGLIKVSNGASVAMLKPGQQALAATGNTNDPVRIDKDADVDEAIAWKNGIFQFNNADLKTVMRQIARWYDVEVGYDDRVPEKRFTGRVSRNLKASELLSGIEYVGVHFKIEGKKILVLP